MTWMVAFSHGMRFPLYQILEVVWMGMGGCETPSSAPGTDI